MAAIPGTSTGGDLLVDIAFFVKAFSIYPTGHSRIRAAGERLITTIRERNLKEENRVVLVLRKHEVFVDGIPRGLSHPIERWFLDACRNARIGGLEISRAVTLESLEQLATTIIGNGLRGSSAAFEADAGSGIRVLDLAYAGRHSATHFAQAPSEDVSGRGTITTRTTDTELMQRLAQSPDVARLIERLCERMSAEFEASPTDVELDLVPRIVALVTADAGYDMDEAIAAIVSTLERLDQKLPSWATAVRTGHTQSGGDLDEELARIASHVARRYFARDVQLVVQDDTNLPQGRPGDEAIVDELEPLLEETAALPAPRRTAPRVDERTLLKHVATIWTHLIANPILPETPDRAAAALKALVDEHPDLDLSHLKAYGPSAAGGDPQASARVVASLLREGLAVHLVRYGAIGHLHLSASFPIGFVDWVRALRGGPRDLPAVLGQALRTIPFEALHRGVGKLIAERAFSPEVLRVMLDCGQPEMLLVIEVLAGSGNTKVIADLVDAMRSSPLPEPEGAAIQLLPARWIPDNHVLSMCRLLLTRSDRAPVREETERLLRAFAKNNLNDPIHLDACVAAIEMLARFPTPETRATCKQLARHPLLGGSAPRPIRRAAREVLKRIGARHVSRAS